MIVRLRFRKGPRKLPVAPAVEPPDSPPARATGTHGASLVLSPLSVIAAALALWRLGVDAGLTQSFMVEEGVLSHWQVWVAVAATLQGAAYLLNRRSRGDDDRPATS